MIYIVEFLFIVLIIFLMIKKKKRCPNCGSKKIIDMPFKTGSYCEDCYDRFD